jgi:hypothetical protein
MYYKSDAIYLRLVPTVMIHRLEEAQYDDGDVSNNDGEGLDFLSYLSFLDETLFAY